MWKMEGDETISTEKENVIVDDIMRQIANQTLKPGTKLPSEYVLVEKYRVPRMTVRNALMKLEEQGIVYSKQGKGRYLKEESKHIDLHLTGKISFTDKMKQLGYDLTTKNVYCEEIPFDAKIYRILQAVEGDTIFKIGRLRYINGEPVAIHNSFVSETNFPVIGKDGPAIESMFAYYRQLGYEEFSSNKSLLSTTFPTVFEQELLACKSMVPLIVVESNCIDGKSEKVLEYTKILYRSDKFQYDITMD
ncbi:GntR family transcriptional regulator [Oceanobacillus profundus]|uniref:GntR family transcriptional regulator n=1 Tax=Oceanobacillus TaxID=182709 RepID=UPI0026E32D6F|nr:GntR family transcriptional regulator [Oceanobacillus profundus]MDO6447718.1 GntR family transcriptional regulator [Oceanobacillus profundus]